MSRITPEQRIALDRLNERFVSVGLEGLTDAELEEILELVTELSVPEKS